MSYEIVEAGELMARKDGSVDPASFPDETFELYSIPAFDRGTPDIVKGEEIGSTKPVVKPNDVLISRIVPHIRRAGIVGPNKGIRQIASSEWIVFRDSRIHPEYLRQYLISDKFNTAFMSTVAGVGGSLLRARPAAVSKIPIPLPPLEEQRRIAEVLDKADALRQKRRLALQKLDTLLQSVFLEMFGDPRVNRENYEIVSPKDIAASDRYSIGIGPFGSSLKVSDYRDNGIPLVFVKNIRERTFGGQNTRFVGSEKAMELRAHSVNPGDFLMTKMGEPPGDCAIYPIDQPSAIITADCIKLTVNQNIARNEYLLALFDSFTMRNRIKQLARGVAQQKINLDLFRELTFPLPPLQRQVEFASRGENIDRLRSKVRRSLEGGEKLFKSLQSRAFEGEAGGTLMPSEGLEEERALRPASIHN